MKDYKKILNTRELSIGKAYMLPRWGFTLFEQPDGLSKSVIMDTNPFTKSLDNHPVRIKYLDKNFVGVNFADNPTGPDFYLYRWRLEERDFVEKIFVAVFLLPFIWLKDRL